jgi:NitT/TauT family transport system substrate-binding protein
MTPRRPKHPSSPLILAPLAIATAFALLSGCGGPPAPKGDLTEIRFATDWKAEAEHGGFYQALATGEYEKRGLKVRILPGGPGSNVPQLLASGAADMGVGSNSFVAMTLAQEHVPVRAVMAVMQKDPWVLMAHPDAGVNGIADMKGRPILLSDASLTGVWVWLKARFGLDDAQVRKYTFNSGPFIQNKHAIQQGYVTSEPYTIEKQGGFKPKVFLLSDEGYPGYADLVLVPDRWITNQPKVVQAFVDATAAGWTSYLHGDPRPGDKLILKDNAEMTQDVLDQAREKMRSYEIVDGAAHPPIGDMTDARWRALAEVMAKAGVLKPGTDVKSAYTLQFLKK